MTQKNRSGGYLIVIERYLLSVLYKNLTEVIPMSTNNIGFYGEISKIFTGL